MHTISPFDQPNNLRVLSLDETRSVSGGDDEIKFMLTGLVTVATTLSLYVTEYTNVSTGVNVVTGLVIGLFTGLGSDFTPLKVFCAVAGAGVGYAGSESFMPVISGLVWGVLTHEFIS